MTRNKEWFLPTFALLQIPTVFLNNKSNGHFQKSPRGFFSVSKNPLSAWNLFLKSRISNSLKFLTSIYGKYFFLGLQLNAL